MINSSKMVVEGTDLRKGLSSTEVMASRKAHGTNELTPPLKAPLWKQWLEKFDDPCIIILCVCAIIAVTLGVFKGEMPWDGVAIFVAVAIATAGGTWSEYKADKAFELLKKDGDKVPVKVRRDGGFHTVASTEIVVGDVVLLEAGDRVPADGTVAEAMDACFDESLMTGESKAVRRQEGDRATGGTYLVSGSATVMVSAVGDGTELGTLASALGHPWACPDESHRKHYRGPGTCEVCGQELEPVEEGQTPLQKRLAGLADNISVWGTIGAVLIFVALIVCELVSICRGSEGGGLSWWQTIFSAGVWPLPVLAVLGIAGLKILSIENKAWWLAGWLVAIAGTVAGAWASGPEALSTVQSVMQFFMVAVTIIVVAVPEGLPLAIFIALGLGMRKIREDNNLVRRMVATETMGSATVICSDKTGTLTLNRMSVVEDQGFSGLPQEEERRLAGLVCAANSTAELERVADGGEKFAGSPTECALLVWLREQGIDYGTVRREVPVLDRLSFSAERKRMSTLVHVGGKRLLLAKGAPERIFAHCESVPKDAEALVAKMASQAIRALALAWREMPAGQTSLEEKDETGLKLLAVVGLADPLREDVPAAVARCGKAGIDVKMVTGDHPLTAHAIAEKIGMLQPGDVEMTGETFEEATNDELSATMPHLRVISRAKPDTKVRLVELLQRRGEVVAMTGDGTNDAPALKKADVGIAMGLRGTDVAKEASDIILTDDNFGSILKAVHWGRTLYENLQKFVQFQLTVNLSALGIAFVSPIVATLFPNGGFEVQPLTVLQYLWINLIMDTLAAIAFGLEPRRPETLNMPPKRLDEPFLTRTMLWNIGVLGLYFIGLILAVEAFDLLGLETYKDKVSREKFELMKASVVFNCYVWFQIFHMFNARSVRNGASAFGNITKSRSFFAIMLFVAVVQVLMVQFGGTVLHTAALPVAVWLKILLLGASAIVVGEILRIVQRIVSKRQPSIIEKGILQTS